MTHQIDAYAERLRAAGRSKLTISTRCRVLRHADLSMQPHGLDGANGDDIIAYLAGVAAVWTKHTYDTHLRGYYRSMIEAGRLTLDPTVYVRKPRPGDRTPDPVTEEELALALSDSPSMPWRTCVILAAYAGLRVRELCALRRQDVTEQRVRVHCGKGGKGRAVPTHPLVWELVEPLPPGRVVRGVRGAPISPESISGRQHLHWRSIGLPEVHMHRFRHWFGTTLVDEGVGIEVVAELMGHASVETTRGYVRASVARHRAAMLTLPIMGAPAGV